MSRTAPGARLLNARRNDLKVNLEFVVDMLREREGQTGGAHARTQSRGVQAKHTILTGLNLLGVLLGKRVSIFGSSVPAADELARTLPEVCLSYTQKNTFETGTELLAMALAHVSWLKDEGGLPPESDLCPVLCQAEGAEWLVRRVTDRLMRMVRESARSQLLKAHYVRSSRELDVYTVDLDIEPKRSNDPAGRQQGREHV